MKVGHSGGVHPADLKQEVSSSARIMRHLPTSWNACCVLCVLEREYLEDPGVRLEVGVHMHLVALLWHQQDLGGFWWAKRSCVGENKHKHNGFFTSFLPASAKRNVVATKEELTLRLASPAKK